jgi:CHAT domain-containing protein/uncharacterized protein HemY
MRRTFILLFVVFNLCLSVAGQVAPEATTLVPGLPVEREIAGGESHTYQFALAAGQFVRAVVEQKAIDVKLALANPDGKPLVEVNLSSVGGAESLSAEAAAGGTYRLTVSANGSATLKGSYSLRLEEKAVVGAQDRQRIDAERLMREADELRNQEGKTAQPVTAQAIVKLEQALAVWRELGDRYWAVLSLSSLGRAHNTLRHFEQAVACHEEALLITRELKKRAEEGRALNNLCFVYHGMARYEKAIDYCEQGLTIAREVNNREGEGVALNNLANAWYSLGRYEKAIGHYEQVLAIMRQVKNRRSEGLILSNLANAFYGLNRYETAISYYEQALSVMRELKNRAGEGRTIFRLGSIYGELSRNEKAIEYKEQALAIARELKDRAEEGSELRSLGASYAVMGRYEQALGYYEQALTIAREVKNGDSEGAALESTGIANLALKRHEKAIEYFEQALAVNRAVKNRRQEGNALAKLGEVNASLSRHAKAAEYFEQSLALHREIKNRVGACNALSALSHTQLALGDIPAARASIEESLKILESMRSDVLSPESRASFLANAQSSYQFYTDLLMRQHRAEPGKGFDALAVETSERQRARSLLDLLAEARTDLRQGIDPALIEREGTLAKQLNEKAQQLTQAAKPEQLAALKQEVSQLENDYERAQAAIRKASPQYAALTQTQPLKLKEIQAQLDADTLLLEYAFGKERSYLWAITRDSLTSYELPKRELIEKEARQLYELLTARSARSPGETAPQRGERITRAETALAAAAHSLSQTLLAPVAAQLGDRRLVVVADGALQYIPFAMLPHPAGGKGEPLVVRHEIVSLPSASALAVQRAELAGRQPAPKLLAVIADPVFDRTDGRFKSPAPEAGEKEQAQTIAFNDTRSIEHLAGNSDDKAGATIHRLVIPRLPFTREESARLLALAPKNSSFGASDFQASRATVLGGGLSQYRYVHFATHGFLDSERPGLSALVLSMVDAEGRPQDGFLRANDIYNLKLPAELVVLSACQTGLGKEVKGEGLVGLTRGFMYAGAPRVVVSLWNVNDKATAELMAKFYEKMLKQGHRPAAALRAAQVEMWKQKQWHSPYYWAAFTMQGEWR